MIKVFCASGRRRHPRVRRIIDSPRLHQLNPLLAYLSYSPVFAFALLLCGIFCWDRAFPELQRLDSPQYDALGLPGLRWLERSHACVGQPRILLLLPARALFSSELAVSPSID